MIVLTLYQLISTLYISLMIIFILRCFFSYEMEIIAPIICIIFSTVLYIIYNIVHWWDFLSHIIKIKG